MNMGHIFKNLCKVWILWITFTGLMANRERYMMRKNDFLVIIVR